MKIHVITQEMAMQIQKILQQGNRAEIMIEQGKIVIVEIRRKLKYKATPHRDCASDASQIFLYLARRNFAR
ncbi:MAG: hypothetical protein LUC50_04390 [Ruminococcus sp.]|nr:hypothetical protein [Ruminococcus sp.]